MAHFLKHLTEETIILKKLLIPPEFVSKCGRLNLTNPLVLEPTVGEPLEVELYEDGGGFWLRNGFQELTDQYSLSHGHYLVFEYKSYSRFKLVMLGANGLDLELPPSISVNQESPEEEKNKTVTVEEENKTVDTDSVEFLGTSLFKGQNSSNNNECGGGEQAQPPSAEIAKRKELPGARNRRTAEGGEKRKADCVAPRRSRAEPVAKRPFSSHHIETNENQDFTESAEEEEDDDASYPLPTQIPFKDDASYMEFLGTTIVKEMHYNNGGRGARQPPQQRSGGNAVQKEFMSARKKSRGNGGENRKVNQEAPRTFRGNGRSPIGMANADTDHTPSMSEQEASQTPSSARHRDPVAGFTTHPDFLQVKVLGSSAKNGLYMRTSFVERHITDWESKTVELKVGEDTWNVRLASRCGVPAIGKGWSVFRDNNSLKAGDTCIFVPTATQDSLRVHIVRPS